MLVTSETSQSKSHTGAGTAAPHPPEVLTACATRRICGSVQDRRTAKSREPGG